MTARLWRPAYVGIGSNLGEPLQNVRRALQQLFELSSCLGLQSSRAYRSAPVGPANQPDYINAVAGFMTQNAPANLLKELQDIEQANGRRRDGERWGPRTLDLDLLAVGDLKIETATLTLPHPEIANRRFVLQPWADIAAHFQIPGLGRVAEYRDRVDDELVDLGVLT